MTPSLHSATNAAFLLTAAVVLLTSQTLGQKKTQIYSPDGGDDLRLSFVRSSDDVGYRRLRKRSAGQSEHGGVVEEVFGRSAVIEADESRRIYAISIPRIFQGERSGSDQYRPPIYRAHSNRAPYKTIRHHGGAPLPPPLHPFPPPPPPHQPWQSGLRLIVSGPVDDHSLKPVSEERQQSYDYGHQQYDYSGPYEDHQAPRENRWEEPSYYEVEPHRQDAEHYVYEEDKQESPPRESTKFFNRPYHKLAEPYSVLDVPVEKKKNSVKISMPVSADRDNHRREQHNIGGSAEQTVPHDYYDNLYEEFMEAAYNSDDDYYDNPDTTIHKKEKNRKLEKPKDYPRKLKNSEEHDVYDSKNRAGSNTKTRRLPPSDMYTTSRSTVQPSTVTAASKKNEAITQSQAIEIIEMAEKREIEPQKNKHRNLLPDITTKAASNSQTSPSTTQSSTTILLPPPSSSYSPDKAPGVTTQRSQIPRPDHPYKQLPSEPSISLSEILQGMDISLPQFLVQLKMHGTDLKQFTAKLEKRALTRTEFKRAEGNVGEILKILDERQGLTKPLQTTTYNYGTTKPTFRRLSYGFTERRSEEITSEITSSTTTTSATHFTAVENSLTSASSTVPSTSPTTTENPIPKRFGFKPSSTMKKGGAESIPTNIEISDSSTASSIAAAEKTTVGTPLQSSTSNENISESSEEETVIYRPYRPGAGGWRERMQHNRGVNKRLGSTTKRPRARPNYTYNGGNTDLLELIKKQDASDTSSSNTKVEIDVVALETVPGKDSNRISLFNADSNVIGLTEGTPMGGNYNHPRYDRDPNSLNIATRSAIMAAGILGGIALAVFLTILVFVMYRNHVGRRRRQLRVPFPLSVASDDSSTSTPPLYSTRSRSGLGRRSSSQTDFWGTLKRKFDPYSISSTSASYY